MILKLIRYLQGYVRIRIIGYSPERFLNLCSHHHIYIWGLSPVGNAYEMFLSVKGFRKLKPIVRKTRTRVVIVGRYGLPFFIHKYRKRYLFFGGAVLCVFLIYFLSLHIWNIHIEGNYSWTDSTILEFLETKDIRHGMWKKKVDCSRIVKDLREEYNDVIWASASLSGTRLIIQIKENMDTMPEGSFVNPQDLMEPPVDLIAKEDGTVVSIVTRKGVPQVEPGSEVKAGDVLVSGQVPVLNDSKEITGYQYHVADADIVIGTQVPYEEKMSITYQAKKYEKEIRHLPFITAGSFRLEAGTLFGLKEKTEKEAVSEEYRWRIGEHFYLPVTVGMTTVKSYTFYEKKHTDQEIRERLTGDLKRFCQELEKKGVQILENNVKIYKENDTAVSRGILSVQKPAGEPAASEKIEVRQPDEDKGEE